MSAAPRPSIFQSLVGREAAGNEFELHEPVEQKDTSPEARAVRRHIMFRAVAGEFIASTVFFFSVCAVAINTSRTEPDSGGKRSSLPGALSSGFAAIAIIYGFAEVSGAHLNPAVSFATWIAGRTSNRKTIFFMLAQILGGISAMLLLMLTYPDPSEAMKLLAIVPNPAVSLWYAFFCEFMLTFILVFVIFTVAFELIPAPAKGLKFKANDKGLTLYSVSPQSKAGFAPLAIGFTISFLALAGGSVSGGAFNPARVFAPALFSGKWDNQWVYWLGDFLGAASAVGVRKIYLFFFKDAEKKLPNKTAFQALEVADTKEEISRATYQAPQA
eukprot:TRINITY_DN1615_c0_g1_i4.p1 TRINITY_DN1615_c0_g1~~TRINITY_DN1615_c0_g1_i4.p1  ORF type:complete len:329 (+),score=72.92 TRINITY_DN1615_c0_g1_i4:144-1130(+)